MVKKEQRSPKQNWSWLNSDRKFCFCFTGGMFSWVWRHSGLYNVARRVFLMQLWAFLVSKRDEIGEHSWSNAGSCYEDSGLSMAYGLKECWILYWDSHFESYMHSCWCWVSATASNFSPCLVRFRIVWESVQETPAACNGMKKRDSIKIDSGSQSWEQHGLRERKITQQSHQQ